MNTNFRNGKLLACNRGTKTTVIPLLCHCCYLCIEFFKRSIMIKTGNPVISIYTEMTPNPETMKFVANKLLYPGKSIDFQDETSASPSPLAQELFTFPFIKSVFIFNKSADLFIIFSMSSWP